ncbi:hypothetical protein [Pseudomonas abietaniphila]|uniref:Uncharacterized protein n=1 Tax=Pseudomonas abietaniphila TaxID=89065 RepID=A0A1G8QXY8_9PSED|nr:hypothetical protein [Pseudomonas abietaniphila]SDJ09604.1 hypothetical protein SAMN05216605_121101 [Pseudomonas abietaniphila]
MGNMFDLKLNEADGARPDVGALIFKAAQRYFFLRGAALRTGNANTPMVRVGLGQLLSGTALDEEVDRVMRQWPALGLRIPSDIGAGADSYSFTPSELDFIRSVLAKQPLAQTRALMRYAAAVGPADAASLFANFMGYTNSLLAWLHTPLADASQKAPARISEVVPIISPFKAADSSSHNADGDGQGRIWSQCPPEQAGYYWNWSGKPGIDTCHLHVIWSADTSCFHVAEGQHGLTHSISCQEWGGWWAAVMRPNAQAEIEAGHFLRSLVPDASSKPAIALSS